jgi:AraC-like DNA-binding protein
VKVATRLNDSPRGRWTYSAWRPAHLAGMVEVIWQTEGTTTEPQDRHYPSPTIELLVNLGPSFRLVEPAGAESFETTWLAGIQHGPVVCEQPPRHGVLGIRLTPAGAYALLARPMHEVSGLVLDLHDLVGHAAEELAARCRDAVTVEQRFRVAAAWVPARVAWSRPVDPVIAWAATRIESSGGAVPIGELRAETGFSKARLVAAFRDQIGVAPKLYARIVRFSRLLGALQDGGAPLSDVALAAGYYDQPHMNAEFREFTGLAPRELLSAGPPFLEGVDEETEHPPVRRSA